MRELILLEKGPVLIVITYTILYPQFHLIKNITNFASAF